MPTTPPPCQACLHTAFLGVPWKYPKAQAAAFWLDLLLQQGRNRTANTWPNSPDSHRRHLLAYFSHCITTRPLEGLNSDIEILEGRPQPIWNKEHKPRSFFSFLNYSIPPFAVGAAIIETSAKREGD
jgi:hypothetical protein